MITAHLIINGKAKGYGLGTLSYDEAVRLAGMRGYPTVIYQTEGGPVNSLMPGDRLEVHLLAQPIRIYIGHGPERT